jgi:anti-sigma factor ChrR (cupin superfamily)
MRINDDLTQPVFVRAAKLDWIPSPAAGVDRRMLFRIGDEVARATSINPPGTSHIPASEDGCTIFVRLWQFRAGDQVQIVRLPGEGDKAVPRKGATTAIVLFDDGREKVSLEDWAADEAVTVENMRGLEFLVLSGEIVVGEAKLEPQGWGRLPAGMALNATVGPQGARIWIKDAPSLHQDACQLPI